MNELPIQLQIGAPHHETWNFTVSKKRLETAHESIVEKRMLCISRPGQSKECCVTKKLLALLEDTAKKFKMAQARLENF